MINRIWSLIGKLLWPSERRAFAQIIEFSFTTSGTHVKISQLVASLQTSRQQVVFAQLVTSCQQVWNKLLTTCNKLVDIVSLLQGCSNKAATIMI